jgi:type I restriction enzyme S subunit
MSLLKKLKEAKKVAIQNGAILNKRDKNLYPILDYPFNKPRHWEIGYLSDVSIIQEGPGIRKHQYTQSGIQFLTVTNILEDSLDLNKSLKYISEQEYETKYKHFEINPGDVVTACSGATWGKSAIFDSSRIMILNTSTLRLRFFGDLGNNKYLFYLSKWNYFKKQVSSFSTGQQPNYGYKHYSKVKIPIPPIHEQQQIVQILDQASEKIDCAIANVQQNIKNAEELFQAKINEIYERIIAISSNRKLGVLLETLTDYHANGSYKILKQNVELKDEEDFAWMVRSTDFENNFKNNFKYIDEHAYNFLRKSKIFGGELIISKIGNAGKVYVMPEIDKPCSLAMNLFLLGLKREIISSEFLYYFFKSSKGENQIMSKLNGTTTKTITKASIRDLNIPVVGSETQERTIQKIKLLEKNTNSVKEKYLVKLNILEKIKKSILQNAFSGKLNLKVLNYE